MIARVALALFVVGCGRSEAPPEGTGSSTKPTRTHLDMPATASNLLPAPPFARPAVDASRWIAHALPRPAHVDPSADLGAALALDGDTLVAGAPGRLFGDAPGAVYVYQRRGATWDAPLALAPPATRKRFGNAVAVSGDTIVAATFGAAVVYERRAGKWGAPTTIELPSQDRPWFSLALALDRDTLAVGIEDWAVSGSPGQGEVLVYERAHGAWAKTAELLAPDGEARRAADDQAAFGWKVALHGDRLAVASRQAKCLHGTDMCGAAYVFERGGGAWRSVLALPQGNPARAPRVGWGLAMDAGGALALGTGEQRAWVVEPGPDGWRDAGTLGELGTADAPGTDFVASVAIRGAIAARGVVVRAPVGLPPTKPGTNEIDTSAMGKERGASPGSVLVYTRGARAWTLAATLAAPDAVAGDEFGAALALGDDLLCVGAPDNGAGEVVAFTRQ